MRERRICTAAMMRTSQHCRSAVNGSDNSSDVGVSYACKCRILRTEASNVVRRYGGLKEYMMDRVVNSANR